MTAYTGKGGSPADRDPDTWDDVLAAAQACVEAGDSATAVDLVAKQLKGLDPASAQPHHRLVAAATLYARIADPNLYPDDLAWALYAYRAASSLYGLYHSASIAAAEAAAIVMFSRGRFNEADALQRQVIQLYQDRGDVDQHLLARIDLARQLHGVGRCGDAVRQATTVWREWTSRHEPTSPASESIALDVTGMLIACHRLHEAAAIIKQANLTLPDRDDPTSGAYYEFIAVQRAARHAHQAVCARNVSHILDLATPPAGTRHGGRRERQGEA
jgi:hypothetical protein